MHYRALHLLNQGKTDEALALLGDAESAYAAVVPPEAIKAAADAAAQGDAEGFPNERVLTDPIVQSALMGMVEVRRYRSIALRNDRQVDAAQVSMRGAEQLALANALVQPIVGARVARTSAQIDPVQRGDGERLDRAADDFRLSLPLTHPFAATELLQAAVQMRDGDVSGALERCRGAVAVLRELKLGVEPQLLEPVPVRARGPCGAVGGGTSGAAGRNVRGRGAGPGQHDKPADRAGIGAVDGKCARSARRAGDPATPGRRGDAQHTLSDA